MSAFVTVGLDGSEADVQVERWENDRGPGAMVKLGRDVQLVASHADPATLRALAVALVDLAEWREDILAAGERVAA